MNSLLGGCIVYAINLFFIEARSEQQVSITGPGWRFSCKTEAATRAISRDSSTALGMTREGAKCWLDFPADKSTLATMIRKDIDIATVIGILLAAGSARAQELNVEQIVKQKVQPILPKNGEGGGVAVAVRMGGKTSFFNYGMASNAQSRPVTADSIFNLGS